MNPHDFVIDLRSGIDPPKMPEPGKEPRLRVVSKKEDSPTGDEAREFVGGYFEIVHIGAKGQLIVSENGLREGLPINVEASKLYGGTIVGDVIHLKGAAKWD